MTQQESDAILAAALTGGYTPEVWSVYKDDIYAALHSMEVCMEHIKSIKADYIKANGSSTLRDKRWIESLDRDIENLGRAIEGLGRAPIPESFYKTALPHPTPTMDEMVNRFLQWRLPPAFNPDCGISFNSEGLDPNTHQWPVGTNLFGADEAKAMIEHILSPTQ